MSRLSLFFLLLLAVSLWYSFFNLLLPKASRFKDFLQRQHIFWHRLFFNLLTGLLVFAILMAFQHYPFLMDTEDASLDLVMQFHSENPPTNEKMPHFVYLDIDNQTHQLWGEPVLTPRNRLQKLITIAVNGGARLVIVDVDVSQNTPIDGLPLPEGLRQHPYDQVLYDYIANYKHSCLEKGSCIPIILNSAFRPLPEYPEDESTFGNGFSEEKWSVHQIRPSFLEEAVKQSAPYVQWASPLFWQSSYDTGVRRWWLFQPVCRNHQPEVIPSVQLLAATIILDGTPDKAQNNINQALAQYQPQNCEVSEMPPIVSSETIPITENLTITEGTRGIRQRIMYHFPWKSVPSLDNWTFRYTLQDSQQQNTVLTVISAQPFLEAFQQGQPTEALKDSIVVIGGSYADGRDMHQTPLGNMPGALIVINSIHSLLQYGEITPLSNWAKFLIMTVLIIVMSFLFTWRQSFLWLTLVGVFMTIVLLWLSIQFLEQGLWINFVLPLLVVELQQIAADFEKNSNNSVTPNNEKPVVENNQ